MTLLQTDPVEIGGLLGTTGLVSLIEQHLAHLRRRNLAAATIGKRRQRLTKYDLEAGGLCSTTPEQIDTYLDGLDLGPKARYGWVSDLHQFFDWAITWGHLEDDPTRRVPRPKMRRGLPRPIDTGDLAVAIDMAEPQMRAWLTLASFGGLRCMEIAGLTVDSLLWDDKLLRLVGKGDKERMVPMHPDVMRCLRAIALPSRGPVFRRPRGGAWPANEVSREGSLYFETLGIGATMHQCRHWFGTQLYRATGDIRLVQELMGHESIQTTAAYVAWSKKEATAAVNSLELGSVNGSLFSDWSQP